MYDQTNLKPKTDKTDSRICGVLSGIKRWKIIPQQKSTHRPLLPSVVPFHHSPFFSSTRILSPARNPISSVSWLGGVGGEGDRPIVQWYQSRHVTPSSGEELARVIKCNFNGWRYVIHRQQQRCVAASHVTMPSVCARRGEHTFSQ